jgi:hypothetical protein
MKLFGCDIRYDPEKTVRVRMEAIVAGVPLSQAAKLRVYAIPAMHVYSCTVYGLFQAVKMHLVFGLGYLRCRRREGAV